jgi:S1-C subfamily serine protease
VLTSHHVIDVAEKIKVQLAGHGELVPAQLTTADPGADIALLKVGLPAEVELAPIPIATTAAQLGQEVYLLGYPFTGTNENTLKVVRGIVSSLPAGPGGGIEIDSPVNPGNSGGPLLSYRGDVLGMVTEKIFSFDPTVTPLGRAIPAERLRRFVDVALRKEGKEPVTNKATGKLSAQELASRLGPSVVLILSIR